MTVVERLRAVEARIAQAEAEAGRAPGSVRLIVVTKTFAAEDIRPLLAAGHRDFGENRVQEAAAKWPALRAGFRDIRLHLVGALQSNKAAEAAALFDVIHSLDRERLAAALAAGPAGARRPELLVQVNTGEEAQKSGVFPEGLPALLMDCRSRGLSIAGLMAIPPAGDSPGPHFALLAKLANEAGVARLSMGMSTDFETAIAFGATDIRIGSAIMGERTTAGGAAG